MTTVRELHNQAMELAESLFINLRHGEPVTDLASRAFDLERAAARLVPVSDRSEPTRSILYRSAAWLGVVLLNTSDKPFEVEAGDRIAQLVIMPIYTPALEVVEGTWEMSRTARAEQGFGSTGVKGA